MRRAEGIAWLLCGGCGRPSDIARAHYDLEELSIASVSHAFGCPVAQVLHRGTWHGTRRAARPPRPPVTTSALELRHAGAGDAARAGAALLRQLPGGAGDWETRDVPLGGALRLERRAAAAGVTLKGHAAVFNQLSSDLGGFREQIAPGAFADTIRKRDDVRSLFNHTADYVLGRVSSGTLRLREDATGLAFENDLPGTTIAHDLVVSIERGDISGMSFAFRVSPNGDRWDVDEQSGLMRTLTRVELRDISPVTYPAYPGTDVAAASSQARAAAAAVEDHRRRRRLHLAELELAVGAYKARA